MEWNGWSSFSYVLLRIAAHVHLDIRVAQRLQLLRAGLDAEQISSCPLCTVAAKPVLASLLAPQ
jgi:copper oxidase (laccase) domain-containing protein